MKDGVLTVYRGRGAVVNPNGIASRSVSTDVVESSITWSQLQED